MKSKLLALAIIPLALSGTVQAHLNDTDLAIIDAYQREHPEVPTYIINAMKEDWRSTLSSVEDYMRNVTYWDGHEDVHIPPLGDILDAPTIGQATQALQNQAEIEAASHNKQQQIQEAAEHQRQLDQQNQIAQQNQTDIENASHDKQQQIQEAAEHQRQLDQQNQIAQQNQTDIENASHDKQQQIEEAAEHQRLLDQQNHIAQQNQTDIENASHDKQQQIEEAAEHQRQLDQQNHIAQQNQTDIENASHDKQQQIEDAANQQHLQDLQNQLAQQADRQNLTENTIADHNKQQQTEVDGIHQRLLEQQLAAQKYNAATAQAFNATNHRVAENSQQLANHEQRIQTLEANNNASFGKLKNEVDDNRQRASAAISGVAAMANIPQVIQGQTFSVGAGVGTTDSESALAVGFSARATEHVVVKASVSDDTQQNFVVGGGVSYGW